MFFVTFAKFLRDIRKTFGKRGHGADCQIDNGPDPTVTLVANSLAHRQHRDMGEAGGDAKCFPAAGHKIGSRLTQAVQT